MKRAIAETGLGQSRRSGRHDRLLCQLIEYSAQLLLKIQIVRVFQNGLHQDFVGVSFGVVFKQCNKEAGHPMLHFVDDAQPRWMGQPALSHFVGVAGENGQHVREPNEEVDFFLRRVIAESFDGVMVSHIG